ncbi:MAG: DUF2059 domain-containing protein [Desulfobacter sp.]|nr:MAG: DUF2059 domain-containing protein [Desulfobacter sp.]
MKQLFLCFLILVSFQTAAAEDLSSGKKLLIDKLLEQMGQSAADTGQQFSNLFIESFTRTLKRAKPDLDPRAFEIVEQEIKQVIAEMFENSDALTEMMYPIYGQRFSEDELKKLIAFYETPLGKKLLRELPAITKEGMQAGQQLGQSLGPKIQKRIQDRFKSEGIEI